MYMIQKSKMNNNIIDREETLTRSKNVQSAKI